MGPFPFLGTGVSVARAVAALLPRALSAAPNEVYVSATGSDTTGNGSWLAPFLTLDRAAEYVNDTEETAFVVHLGVGTFTWNCESANQFPSSSKTVLLLGAGTAETVVSVTGTNLEEDVDPTIDTGVFYAAGAGALTLKTTLQSVAEGHEAAGYKITGAGQRFRAVHFDGATSTTRIFTLGASSDPATLVDCTGTGTGDTLSLSNVSVRGGAWVRAQFDCSTVGIVEGARMTGASAAIGNATEVRSVSLNSSGLVAVTATNFAGSSIDAVNVSLSVSGTIEGCRIVSSGNLQGGAPLRVLNNYIKAAGTSRALFIYSGISSAVVWRGNMVINTGTFGEAEDNGVVALLQVFNCSGRWTIRDNVFDTATIAIMWGHTNTSLDSTINSQDRDATISGNYFRCYFAAETGPEDPHVAFNGRGRGRIVLFGNVYDVNSSDALRLNFNHACVDIQTATAGTLAVFMMNETYLFTGTASSMTGSAKKAPIQARETGGGTLRVRVANPQFDTVNATYTFAGTGAGTLAVQGVAGGNAAPSFEVDPSADAYNWVSGSGFSGKFSGAFDPGSNPRVNFTGGLSTGVDDP